ncbi:MAG TPA: hypothetical protein VN703_05125 [Candidatus Sulfopaludibacter sp.]|nr:hypothetical protein [Candidatus Sulfopaludibacter sp.]
MDDTWIQNTLEKKRIEELRYRLPVGSVLLFEGDEKGSIAAKTYGGTSWSLVQIIEYQ